MKSHVKFRRSVTVEGRKFAAGDVAAASELPAGSLDSCLRVGHCEPCDAPTAPEAKEPKQGEPKQPKK